MKNGIVRSMALLAALVCGLGIFAATPAVAQNPYFSVTVYEVREGINCNPGPSTDTPTNPLCLNTGRGFGTRIADATLTGTASGNLIGGVVFDASSVLSQVDWTGPAHGTFTITTAEGRIYGRIAGTLDLSMAAAGIAPFAPITGHWNSSRGTLSGVGGTFSGIFYVPLPCGAVGVPIDGFCYVDPMGWKIPTVVAPLQVGDYSSTGLPLVKAFVDFFAN